MREALFQVRTLALKELADVRRSHVLTVMAVFMLAASFVSLIVATQARANCCCRWASPPIFSPRRSSHR